MNMIDCVNAIEQESIEFMRLLSAIDGVESVSYPRITYACQGIDMTAVVRRNKKDIDVGVAYRADGNKNRTYWVSYLPAEWPNEGYETEYTPNDEFNELAELIKQHT